MSAAPTRMPPAARPRFQRRVATLGAVGLLLCAAASPSAAQLAFHNAPVIPRDSAGRDTAYVEGPVQLNIEDGPSDVMLALFINSTLLLPVHRFLDMAEVRVEAFALHDSVVAVLEPGHVAVVFKPGAGVLTRGPDSIPYDTLDVAWYDGDLFVATSLLDRLLGVSTSVEWSNVSAIVGRTAGLPVVQRLRRERRHQLLYRPAPAGQVLDVALRQRVVDGAVFTWSLTAATSGPTDQLAAELGFGTGLLGGSAEVRPQLWDDHGASSAQLQASWSRAWTDSPWIRQIRLGDVQTNGLRSMLVEGAVVTNAPFIRSSQFDVEPIVGNVPAGWEAELYDGGRLLGYSEAGALGAFLVPLQLRYGENPFNLVLYGPSGEVVQQKRTIRVPVSRLPVGQFEYAFAVGRCQYDPCDALVSTDFRYGLSSHVTLQGGSDGFFQGVRGALWQPYAAVSAAPTAALGLSGEAVVNGHLRALADYEPNEDLHASATFTRYTQAGALYSGAVSGGSETDGSVFWRPGWMHGALYLDATGVLTDNAGLRQGVERVSATTQIGVIRYSLGVLYSKLYQGAAGDSAGLAFDASADAILRGPWPWLRGSTVEGQLAVEPAHGLSALRASIGHRISRLLRLDAAVGWFRTGGATLELGLTTATAGPRVGTRSRLATQTGSSELTFASGSVAWDPRTRLVKTGDAAALDRSGVSGVLFRDDNGNGVQDPGEPGLPDIPIRVGGLAAQTDSEGRFAVWGLFPTEPVQIDVDTLSLPDPHMLLPAPVIRVRPSPNAFGAVALPVVVGAEIAGFVVLGEEPVPGVPVVLRDLNSGKEITVVTFANGGFYRGAVPPGDYEVTLPDAVLDRLNAYAPPLEIFVPPGPGDKNVFGDLQLTLQPRQ
ncbi:MAG TPA: carboxypeptidase-like regulatory domain-containing protein [Gemmatimonadales bacterium]|nr:carboxypeptidase-like regulatory domain-containing protein [Gemmatimonadales bacterium]